MPTYEYYCEKCKGRFDYFQSMKDPVLEICPENACLRKKWGRGKVKRQLGTGAGLIFKGSGFYITDYRSEGYKEAAKKESGGGAEKPSKKAEPAASPAKADTKAGQKPAGKKDSA